MMFKAISLLHIETSQRRLKNANRSEKNDCKNKQNAKEKLNMGNNNQDETVNQNGQEVVEQPTQEQPPKDEQPKESELLKVNAELQTEVRKMKKMIDTYSSQISSLKKELSEKVATEGAQATKQSEEMESIKTELEKAKKDIAFRNTVDGYLAMGMDKDYATKVAQMKVDGEEESVNTLLKGFIDSERKKVKEETTAELYAKMPAPVSGNGDGQIDYDKMFQEKLNSGDLEGAIHAQLMGAQQKANQ